MKTKRSAKPRTIKEFPQSAWNQAIRIGVEAIHLQGKCIEEEFLGRTPAGVYSLATKIRQQAGALQDEAWRICKLQNEEEDEE